jgi:hypothetical protein
MLAKPSRFDTQVSMAFAIEAAKNTLVISQVNRLFREFNPRSQRHRAAA